MTRRLVPIVGALLALAALVALSVVAHHDAAPSSASRSTAHAAVARCEAVITGSQSVIWTRPVVTSSVLEAAGATPSVAAQWQSAATPGQVARHDDEVPRFTLVGVGPTGSGELVVLSSALSTHAGAIGAWWSCKVAGGRVVELTEAGA